MIHPTWLPRYVVADMNSLFKSCNSACLSFSDLTVAASVSRYLFSFIVRSSLSSNFRFLFLDNGISCSSSWNRYIVSRGVRRCLIHSSFLIISCCAAAICWFISSFCASIWYVTIDLLQYSTHSLIAFSSSMPVPSKFRSRLYDT